MNKENKLVRPKQSKPASFGDKLEKEALTLEKKLSTRINKATVLRFLNNRENNVIGQQDKNRTKNSVKCEGGKVVEKKLIPPKKPTSLHTNNKEFIQKRSVIENKKKISNNRNLPNESNKNVRCSRDTHLRIEIPQRSLSSDRQKKINKPNTKRPLKRWSSLPKICIIEPSLPQETYVVQTSSIQNKVELTAEKSLKLRERCQSEVEGKENHTSQNEWDSLIASSSNSWNKTSLIPARKPKIEPRKHLHYNQSNVGLHTALSGDFVQMICRTNNVTSKRFMEMTQNLKLPDLVNEKHSLPFDVDNGISKPDNKKTSAFHTPKIAKLKEPFVKEVKIWYKECEKSLDRFVVPVDQGYYAAEMTYILEYGEDMVEVEAEKQLKSWKLSNNFLTDKISQAQREIIISFLIKIAKHSNSPLSLLYRTVKLFDVAIDRMNVDIEDFQLVALSCFWLTLKMEANFHKIPMATQILSYAMDLYENRKDLLIKCEKSILNILQYQITFPDPCSLFLYYVIKYSVINEKVDIDLKKLYYCGGYMIELSLLDSSSFCTSAIALALVVAELSWNLNKNFERMKNKSFWLKSWQTIANLTRTPLTLLQKQNDKIKSILLSDILVSSKKNTVFYVVYKKYRHSRYGAISNWLQEVTNRAPIKEFLHL